MIGLFDFMMTLLKKVLPKSISSRFFLILITPVVVSQIVFGVVFFGRYTENIFTIVSEQIAGDIKVISRALDLNFEKKFIDDINKDFDIKVEIIKDSKLKTMGLKKKTKVYRMLKFALDKKNVKEYFIMPINRNIHVYVNSSDHKNVYKMSFFRKKMYTMIIPVVLGWGVASSIILLIIAFIFLKNQIKPIKRLANAAEQFGNGLDNNTFKPDGAREIRMAGEAFCKMKSSFRKLISDRMRTLAGISHDLRTPLTKMKLQLGMMPKTKENQWLMKDVDMMIRITKSFTLHAAEQNKEMFTHRNMLSFLNEFLEDYKSDNFNINIEGDKSIDASIKYISLKRAFGNIISNAKKYSKNIYITFKKIDDKVCIYFEDDGPGIDQEIIDTIFLPFVGQNRARTHGDDVSVGLGLSIARDAIIGHGGEINASKSKKYGGAVFTVVLPLHS